VLSTPKNLRGPIGGGSGRTAAGTSQIPGNTVPAPPLSTRGVNGASVPQPVAPSADRRTNTLAPDPAATVPNSGVVAGRVGANLRTGTITNFTDTSVSFREGANTSTLKVTPNTVVQMDGRNITLRDIPANAQVRLERHPRFANTVQRIVVAPQAAGASTGGTSVNTQTGTGSTGSANRSLPNDINAPTGNSTTPGGDINAATANATTPGGDINAATGNATTPGGDINAATPNATTPGGDLNAPVANQPETSNRPFAPGQNPADRPVAPFTRGGDQRLQAGFNEPANQQNSNQQTGATTNSNQTIAPRQPKPASTVNNSSSLDTGNSAASPVPGEGANSVADNTLTGRPQRPPLEWRNTFNTRFGGELTTSPEGLTVSKLNNQSFAARSGLRAGDRIQSINGQTISSPVELARALQTANQSQTPINAQVFRNGTTSDVALNLPTGFFNGLTIPATASGAAGVGLAPIGSVGAGGAVVTPDGQVGVNAGGVVAPVTGEVNTGVPQGGAAAAAAATTTEQPANQAVAQQAPLRSRPLDPPVGTQRAGVTTEALKVPDVDLGWTLKATPEGVVMSSLVEDGLAAKNKFETGDLIEAIDGRPVSAPGAISYELHRHRAGATVDFTILRNGKRLTESVTLPDSHKPLLLNKNETFGQANNNAKEQGGSGAKPVQVTPTEESKRTLEEEVKALRAELEELRRSKKP
jgi:S1-C subfamily serine protease